MNSGFFRSDDGGATGMQHHRSRITGGTFFGKVYWIRSTRTLFM